MTNVLVGVHVHEQPEQLLATVASLHAETEPAFELLLLPDGADEETRATLATLADVTQSPTDEPRGAAACFNRLVSSRTAATYVLLESGSLVAPGWLARLLAALAADPRNGLAGPSTNLAWNEQAVARRSGSTPADVAATGAAVAARFGEETRTLEPLHSLADFCYAVERRVVEAIGGADEAYGLGPCWEMDYSIRAARAGFRAVWACGAYVHRSPFTRRRSREEACLFGASRRLYQDRFCGLRLRGERQGYEPACRGESCEHFAPVELVHTQLPLTGPHARAQPVRVRPRLEREAPLVTCVMPTRDRADYALQAVRYFERQDYPNRELVIVDDGSDGLEARLPADLRIRYVRSPSGEAIGAKRNRGCSVAAGSIVAQWDDDDWYAPARLRRQVEPILAGDADVTALRAGVFLDIDAWASWRVSPALHRRLFVEDVHGGTLVYRREVWERGRYPSRSIAEDAWFLHRAVRTGARLRRLDNDDLFVYLRHAANAWAFACGEFLDPGGWLRADEPPLPAADRAFYAARSPAAPARSHPLVSCVMPTADRLRFVPQAIRYFQRQDYPSRELVVLDDGRERVGGLIPPDPRIRYVALERPLVLGAKRNRACELARGEVIVHWDDDDWTAPHRLSYQVAELERHGADVCGLSQQLYLDPAHRAAWLYRYPSGRRPWVAGNTLCYPRELWARNPFREVAVGEDSRFVWSETVRNVLPLADHRFHVGVIHDRNASPKATSDPYWRSTPVEDVEALLGADAAFYVGNGR